MTRLLEAEALHRLPRAEIESFQDQKFSDYVQRLLLATNRYYRELFQECGIQPDELTSIADWRRLNLPLMRKSEYRDGLERWIMEPAGREEGLRAYEDFCSATGPLPSIVPVGRLGHLDVHVTTSYMSPGQADAASYYNYLFELASAFLTGGTSGNPTPVYHTRMDRDLFRIANTRMCMPAARWLADGGDRIVSANLYPHAAHQAWWALAWGQENTSHFHVGLSGGGVTPTPRIADIMSHIGVNLITGMPSYFRNRLVPAIISAAAGGRKYPKRMVVSVGAEAVSDIAREDIEKGLHEAGVEEVLVIGLYGASELRFLVFSECVGGTGYHSMAPDMAAVRTVKMKSIDDWEFTEPGEEGVLVCFPFDGCGSSLVGFVLGDLAVLETNPCPGCGSSTDRVIGIRRETDVVSQVLLMGMAESKVKGATVNVTDLRAQLLLLQGIQEVQIVIDKDNPADGASADVLRVRVALRPGADDDEARGEVIAETRRLTEVTPVFEVVDVAALMGQSLKFRPIVDARPAG